jgi:hypothetical protein
LRYGVRGRGVGETKQRQCDRRNKYFHLASFRFSRIAVTGAAMPVKTNSFIRAYRCFSGVDLMGAAVPAVPLDAMCVSIMQPLFEHATNVQCFEDCEQNSQPVPPCIPPWFAQTAAAVLCDMGDANADGMLVRQNTPNTTAESNILMGTLSQDDPYEVAVKSLSSSLIDLLRRVPPRRSRGASAVARRDSLCGRDRFLQSAFAILAPILLTLCNAYVDADLLFIVVLAPL